MSLTVAYNFLNMFAFCSPMSICSALRSLHRASGCPEPSPCGNRRAVCWHPAGRFKATATTSNWHTFLSLAKVCCSSAAFSYAVSLILDILHILCESLFQPRWPPQPVGLSRQVPHWAAEALECERNVENAEGGKWAKREEERERECTT